MSIKNHGEKRLIKKKNFIFLLMIVWLAVFSFNFNIPEVFAQGQASIIETTDQAMEVTPLGNEDPRVIAARIIQVFLGFLGAVALVLFIYAGFIYMTSGGDSKKIEKAKQIMVNAIIGLAIIIMSFAIVSFILSRLTDAFGIGQGGQYEYRPPGLGSGSLGRVIQDHFPANNMVVSRNTVIMVTFVEPIWPGSMIAPETITCVKDEATVCSGTECVVGAIQPNDNVICTGRLDLEAMKVYRACDSVYPAGAVLPEDYTEANRNIPNVCNLWTGNSPEEVDLLVGDDADTEVTITPDFKTIVFNPYGVSPDDHLGSALNDTGYLVQLTNEIINLNRNQGIFTSETNKSYTWMFTTDTTLDLTPPFVTGVYPVELDVNGQPLPISNDVDNNGYPRNSRIRVDFSEPIIPPAYINFSSNNITDNPNAEILISVGETVIEGQIIAGINGYRSVVFKPLGTCGSDVPRFNSCGELLTCLPALAEITGLVKSVPVELLVNNVGPTASLFPGGGIVDAALNALDTDGNLGRGNGQTQGVADNFSWLFKTSNEVDLSSPLVVSKTPGIEDEIALNALVSVTFTKSLDPSTTINKNMMIISDVWDGWYTGNLLCPEQTAADGSKFCFTNDKVAQIKHGSFTPAQAGEVPLFYPLINSGVQDMMGNCFNPGGEKGADFDTNDQNPIAYCNGEVLNRGQSCCAVYDGEMEIVDAEQCPY